MKAIWNGKLVAQSDDTVVVEGNHYFPPDAIDRALIRESSHTSLCPWKGTARYYDLVVDGQVNENAVWYYPETKPEADHIRGRVAFWKGVRVES